MVGRCWFQIRVVYSVCYDGFCSDTMLAAYGVLTQWVMATQMITFPY